MKDSLPRSQWVKDLTPYWKGVSVDRKKFLVPKEPNLNQSQNRLKIASVLTLLDVTPGKFKGEVDNELIPMDIEEPFAQGTVEEGGKLAARNLKGKVGKVLESGPRKELKLVQDVLNLPLMIRIQDIVALSQNVQ